MSKKLAKVGEYRTKVVKKGVFLHVRKKARGVMGAKYLRRTKARARATGKPRVERVRTNIPEREKPTPAMRRAWARNIKKAQMARRRM